MPTTPANITPLIKDWLDSQAIIQFAVLFGSYAKGNYRNDSDIDLAIALASPITSEEKLTLLQSFGEVSDKIIDLVDLKTVGEPLLNQIIQHGKQLKGSHLDFIELSIKNVNMMQDFTPYIERTLKQKRERWLQNG